jgi:hypothetical protein
MQAAHSGAMGDVMRVHLKPWRCAVMSAYGTGAQSSNLFSKKQADVSTGGMKKTRHWTKFEGKGGPLPLAWLLTVVGMGGLLKKKVTH